MGKLAKWLAENWAVAVTAAATAVTALLLWLDRHDRKRRELPFVECWIDPVKSQAGWFRINLIVRNFNPYAVHVVELRIKRPRAAAIFSEWAAFKQEGATQTFAVTDAKPQLVATIDKSVAPLGTEPTSTGMIILSHGDRMRRDFYFSPGPGRSGRIKVKMVLICEVRSREVRRKEIAITRTIKL
jgi:hypothetical protein